MNIVFLLRSVSSSSGVDIITRILANEFIDSGYNVNLCCLTFSDNLVNSKVKHFEIFGNWQKIDTSQNINILKNALLKENIIINQECQNISWTNLAKKTAENSNTKIISCLHFPVLMSMNYFGKRARFFPSFFAKFFKKYRDLKNLNYTCDNSDLLVFLSGRFLEHYKKLQPKKNHDKLRVIANPLSLSFKEVDFDEKQKTILFVGRISEFQKRLSFIIDVWKIILNTKKYNDWNLKIVGDGDDLESIKENTPNKIYFEGKQNSESYFENASIFFMTSAFEGFPMTLVESLQRGCVPVVMDSFLSLKDIIKSGENGVISPNNDIEVFAKNAMQLMDDENLLRKMAENAPKSVEKFAVNNILKQWEKLFESLKRNS